MKTWDWNYRYIIKLHSARSSEPQSVKFRGLHLHVLLHSTLLKASANK